MGFLRSLQAHQGRQGRALFKGIFGNNKENKSSYSCPSDIPWDFKQKAARTKPPKGFQ